jgi:hypothetical protein
MGKMGSDSEKKNPEERSINKVRGTILRNKD